MQQQSGYVAPGAGTLANGRQLADPWLRIGARIIDSILVFVVSLILSIIFFGGAFAFTGFGDGSISIALQIVATLVVSALAALYYYLMNSFVGGTLGKLALGIRIADNGGNEPIGPSVGFVRTLMNIIPIAGAIPFVGILTGLITIVVGLVSTVFLFTDPEHRTVMDRMADTYVVKK